jgi:hypothetical protein
MTLSNSWDYGAHTEQCLIRPARQGASHLGLICGAVGPLAHQRHRLAGRKAGEALDGHVVKGSNLQAWAAWHRAEGR